MRIAHRIILLSAGAGLIAGAIDAIIDTLVFNGDSFLDNLIFDVSPEEAYVRGSIFLTFLVFGTVVSRLFSERERIGNVMQASEKRCRGLFEDSPISLWEEDFYEVKRRIQELRKSGVNDFRKYLKKNPEAMEELGNLIRVVDVNKATLKLYGAKDRRELLGKLTKIFGKESYATFREELIAVAENKTVFESETVIRTLAGEKKNVFLRWSVAPGYEETLSRVMVSVIDITERKQAERALKRYAKKIEEANHLKELFIDIMSHDLLNPASIAANIAGLMKDWELDEEREELVRVLEDSSRRIIEMTEDARTYAQIESSRRIKKEKLDLNEVFKEIVEDFKPLLEEKRMDIKYLPKGRVHAAVNPMIENVFSNLLSNAIKYSPEGGEIEVGVARERGACVFYAKDWGLGIEAEDKSRLFARFERLEKGEIRGTGLGLAIAKRIVEMHKGKIWVEDNPEGGSVFYVRIPQ